MTHTFTRNVPVVVNTQRPDNDWRRWAYDECQEAGVGYLPGCTLTFSPTVLTSQQRFGPSAAWPVIDLVVDGLAAAGVIRSRVDLAAIVCEAAVVGPTPGARLTITPREAPDGH